MIIRVIVVILVCLLGMFFRMVYKVKKYYLGMMCVGVVSGLVWIELFGWLRVIGVLKVIRFILMVYMIQFIRFFMSELVKKVFLFIGLVLMSGWFDFILCRVVRCIMELLVMMKGSRQCRFKNWFKVVFFMDRLFYSYDMRGQLIIGNVLVRLVIIVVF